MALFGLIKDKSSKAADTSALPIMRELPPLPRQETADAKSDANLESIGASLASRADPILPTSEQLLQMLFAAIASGDEPRLAALANDYHDFIVEFAPSWIMIPGTLADNRPAAEWYMSGIELIVDRYTTPPENVATPPPGDTLGE